MPPNNDSFDKLKGLSKNFVQTHFIQAMNPRCITSVSKPFDNNILNLNMIGKASNKEITPKYRASSK